ncbi:glycosyltransferase family 2 protein [Flavobacterium artemisiae]|uniref:Glycosyltransferase family 2 protein n=1 Tax=Flavobacterium artemisiae TaxID=2126556 RepID=A0ABW4H8T1_9FLAO
MKTSIVIVTFNGMKWIENCIESILKSTMQPEIIVVDNCSTDDTVHFLKNKYSEKIILIESNENLGFGRANNLGISLALQSDSDFIFLLNQDTIIQKDTVEKLFELAIKNPDFGIISPIHTNGDGSSLDISFLYYINKQCQSLVSDSILNKEMKDIYQLEMINAAAWFLPRKTLESVGGFDPLFFLYGEDDNFCQRVLYHKLKIGITPLTAIKHDSGNNFKVDFPKGSPNFYNKFLNRVKVQYGDVNTNDFKKLDKLKRYFLKEAFISFLKLNFTEYQVNKKKYKLINPTEIKLSVTQNRELGLKYLH